jgi:uncharacterized RDD family membrane protein YckC
VDNEFNPYSAPAAAVIDAADHRQREVAGKWLRFGTLVIDYICFYACGALLGLTVGMLFGRAGIAAMQKIPGMALGALLVLAFYCFFEGLWGRTPGKLVFGTAVVNRQGEKPKFSQIIGRTLCRFIPFEAFSFLGDGEGWHDAIPKTQVVRVRGR